ncbi:MAG TPA: FAD:protein FMN transferase [Roseovarius sp.]
MKATFTRRRFLAISAAGMTCAAMPTQARESVTWTGHAMGAQARMTLAGPLPNARARSIFRAVEQELARLERIFSLHNSKSQIVQLNRTGILRAPAVELLEVLDLCDALHMVSRGAFDPTLQPLWLAHATAAAQGRILSGDELAEMRQSVGWRHLQYDAGEVRFDRPKAGLTLNGVAQGYVTDQIAKLLRGRGLDNVVVDMGEIAVLGEGSGQIGIATPEGRVIDRITLRDRAMATSAPMGTILDPETGLGHIFDYRDGKGRPKCKLVSVSAPTAAVADGLSTALCLMPRDDIQPGLARFPGASLQAMI